MTLQKLSAYGKGFQIKVLGALLTQKDFLINVRDTLKSEYFDLLKPIFKDLRKRIQTL